MVIKNLFEFLFQPGEAIEVRVVQPWCGSGFFDNAAELQAALERLDAVKPDGVYCTLNPVTREAFERAPNEFRRAVRGKKLACSSADIAARKWILIDCDALRPKNVSATDAEKSLALAKAAAIRDFLLSEGAPAMVEADSGNGGHLLLACDLPNDKESTLLVRGFLDYLSSRFTDGHVKVDAVNFNPDRITKAYGTLARKGPDTPERPHRRSGILSLPDVAIPVSRELLERLQLKPKVSGAKLKGFGDSAIRLLTEWADSIPDFPAIREVKRESDRIIVIPEYCYLNADHTGTSAGVVFHADGGRGNACKHEGCNLPFKEWWAKVEALYSQPLHFDPQVVIGKPKTTGWTLQNYAAIQVERVSWIFPNYLARGMPTCLGGEPGEGKSLTTVDWAARITTGRGFPDGTEATIPPSSVLMLNSEDNEANTIKPRFLAAGGDPSRLYQLKLPMGTDFFVDSEEDVRRLGEQLTLHPDIACITIDPISQHALSEKEQDIRRGVASLRTLIKDRGVALLYVTHFNKVGGKNLGSPLDKVGGAKAWTGLPRFVFVLMRGITPDLELGRPRHHLIRAKSNLGAYDLPTQDFTIESHSTSGKLVVGGQPAIRWMGESTVSMRELLMSQERKQTGPTALEGAMALIESELTDQPRPASEIIEVLNQAGVKEVTRNRAKSKLFFSGAIATQNIGGVWYWRRGSRLRNGPDHLISA